MKRTTNQHVEYAIEHVMLFTDADEVILVALLLSMGRGLAKEDVVLMVVALVVDPASMVSTTIAVNLVTS